MSSHGHIGLVPIPSDVDISEFLRNLILDYGVEYQEFRQDFTQAVSQTQQAKEPYVFAYAKMLNHLATLEKPELIRMLASAVWEDEAHG